MTTRAATSLGPILLALLLATPLAAQRFGRDAADWYPLGGIEAWGDLAVVGERPAIEIKKVAEGGLAARAGLVPGDRIVAAGGKKLSGKSEEVVANLCEQIDKAEGRSPRGEFSNLVLEVQGTDGKSRKVDCPVRPLGSAGKTPEGDAKSAAVLAAALDSLAREQGEEGNFPKQVANENQALVTASLAGLAFLGAGEKYRANHERALAYVMAHVLDGGRGPGETGANWNQTNWSLGYGGIYLAEVCARDSRSPAREVLAKVVKRLEENQEQTGGYAHGPGGPNALGYLELEIVSNFAIAALGMAKRAGIEADEARTVKAIEYVKSCTSGGGVAYSTRPGQAGAGEAGRTAGAYWAFRQAGRDGRFEDGMAKYFERGLGRLTEGHVSPAMHILAGGLASSFRGKKSMSKFWKIYLPYVMSCRVAGGAFDARPTEESRSLQSNSDRSNGPAFITAHYALLLQLGQDRFKLLDR